MTCNGVLPLFVRGTQAHAQYQDHLTILSRHTGHSMEKLNC